MASEVPSISVEAAHFREQGNEKFKEGRLIEACRLYTIAIDLDPNCAASYGNRAQVYLGLKMPKLAVEDATKAISIQPSVKAYFMMGSLTEAQEQCADILKTDPFNKPVKALQKDIKQEIENVKRCSAAQPQRLVRHKLSQLPLSNQVWKIYVQKLKLFLKTLNGHIYRPYGVLIFQTDKSKAHLRAYKLMEKLPTPAMIVDTFLSACITPSPASDENQSVDTAPAKPKTIIIHDNISGIQELETLLAKEKIAITKTKLISEEDSRYISVFSSHIEQANQSKPSNLVPLLKVDGVKMNFVSSFYDAATKFFEKDPWLYVTTSKLFSVKIEKTGKEKFYLLLSNIPGTIGLSVFETKEDAIESSKNTLFYPAQGRVYLAYVPIYHVPHGDIDLFEREKISLPKTSHSYPLPVWNVVDRKGAVVQQRPTLSDMKDLHVGLLALPDFILKYYSNPGMEYTSTISDNITIEFDSQSLETVVTLHGEAFPLDQFQNGIRVSRLQNDGQLDQIMLERSIESESIEPAVNALGDESLVKAYKNVSDAYRALMVSDRIKLAREALSMSESCLDAYILLAEDEAETITDMIQLYEQGKAAGEKVIGLDYIESLKKTDVNRLEDRFWMKMDDPKALLLRGYLKCCAGLGSLYGRLNRLKDASSILQHVMEVNPHDNQAVRFSLVQLLLEENFNKEALDIMDQYPTFTVDALFNRALALYRLEGPSEKANSALKTALHTNKFVGSFISSAREYPVADQIRSDLILGAFEELTHEALSYVSVHTAIWRRTPGAIDWASSVHDNYAFAETRE